jgi:hypothetical protein
VQELFPTDGIAKSKHYKQFQETVDDKFLDPEFELLSDEAMVYSTAQTGLVKADSSHYQMT